MTPAVATAAIEDFQRTFAAVRAEMARVVIGHEQAIEAILTAFFAGGHVLIEGVPGIGKTLIVRSLAEALNLSFNRIQFTVDLMPADITGTRIINESPSGRRELVFVPGPIFAHLLLGDEINRATPKTQSALLEAMAEQQVTVAGTSHRLVSPFFVLDGVLGGDHHERRAEGIGRVVDGDLTLGHRLEQRRLGLGRRPVDLVAQHDRREDRSGPELELPVASIPHRHPDDVGRQQVGGELDPAEMAVDGPRQCFGQAGLADPWHILDQEVALGDHAEQREVDDLGLALDDPLDVGGDGAEDLREAGLVRHGFLRRQGFGSSVRGLVSGSGGERSALVARGTLPTG